MKLSFAWDSNLVRNFANTRGAQVISISDLGISFRSSHRYQ